MQFTTTRYRWFSLWSLMKLCGALSLSLGMLHAVINFLVFANNAKLVSAIIVLITYPIMYAVLGAVFAVVTYLPFTFIFLPLQKGIVLRGMEEKVPEAKTGSMTQSELSM